MTLNYEWTGTPMKINILSPSSQIYAESNVSLTYTINRPSDWTGYSLDGAKNATLWDSHNGNPETANTTLTGLAIGVHSVALYTNDSWGNMDSKTITPTVEKSENRLFGSTNTIAVIAITVTIVCVIIGILFFQKASENRYLKQLEKSYTRFRLYLYDYFSMYMSNRVHAE